MKERGVFVDQMPCKCKYMCIYLGRDIAISQFPTFQLNYYALINIFFGLNQQAPLPPIFANLTPFLILRAVFGDPFSRVKKNMKLKVGFKNGLASPSFPGFDMIGLECTLAQRAICSLTIFQVTINTGQNKLLCSSTI